MGRRQVRALILADPISVRFIRREKISTPSGGWRWGLETVLAPQRVTLIPFKRRMTEFLVNTELGDVPDLPYVMLGEWNLDVKEGDTFTHLGEKYEVKTIDLADRETKTAAHVDYYGATSG